MQHSRELRKKREREMASLALEATEKKAMWLYPKVVGFNPSERWGHSTCYSQGTLYVFGGCCGGMYFTDVLLLNLDTMVWDSLISKGQGPGPRDSHTAVTFGNRMVVFGGTNGSKKVNDLHILDFVTKEWTKPKCKGTPPLPRESHSATLVSNEKLVIYGGSGEGESNYLNDLHILDLKTMTWTSPEVKGDHIPVPRDSHSAVAIGNKLFVYGGDCGDRYHGDVDVLDMNSMTWSRLSVQGSSPGVRAGHAVVNIGTKVLVIGGVGNKHYYNDVWSLDVNTCSWKQLEICGQQPQGRFSHTAVVADSDIAIYGGCGEDERPLNDVLVLQLGKQHHNDRYNVSMCKIFGNYFNDDRRRSSIGATNKMKDVPWENNTLLKKKGCRPEPETKPPSLFKSGTLRPKRKRTTSAEVLDIESNQELHSLSLSQNSSASLSDQENKGIHKGSNSVSAPQGLNLFKQLTHTPCQGHAHTSSSKPKELGNAFPMTTNDLHVSKEPQTLTKEQCLHAQINIERFQVPLVEQKPLEGGPIHNLIGTDIQGKVDGAFDSGFLMSANVDGKLFRGLLFAPFFNHGTAAAPLRAPILAHSPSYLTSKIPAIAAQPIMNPTNHGKPSMNPCQQPANKIIRPSSQSFRQHQMTRSSTLLPKGPTSLRSDIQDLFLSLGGPESSRV